MKRLDFGLAFLIICTISVILYTGLHVYFYMVKPEMEMVNSQEVEIHSIEIIEKEHKPSYRIRYSENGKFDYLVYKKINTEITLENDAKEGVFQTWEPKYNKAIFLGNVFGTDKAILTVDPKLIKQ